MIADGEFIEYAEVHGNIYGTSKSAVKAVQDTGRICVLDIDVQGAQKVAQSGIPFVGIFIKPPSQEELERRLRGRGTETEEKVQKRLDNSIAEIAFCDTHAFFCYELVNNNVDTCYKELVAAIAQGTQSHSLPSVPLTVEAAPLCGVKPGNA
ncbi:Guanylate kinase 2 [Diplonema papillatum]|nr:Guanylate kinase 2 [Diplonema papillatum]